MSQYYDKASLVVVPSGYKAGTVYAQKPLTTDGQLTFTRTGDTATRVNSAGLIEKVRTNLVLQSEAFNSASWNTTRATITANATTAPNGTATADLFTDGTFTANNCFSDQAVSTSGTYNMSGFVKAGTSPFIALILYDDQDNGVLFNTSTQTITTFGTITNEKVESVGNGWYRLSFARTVSAATSFAGISVRPTNSIGPYNGTASLTAFFWGVQLETGDIATSYIPTTTAAVSVGPVANVPRLDYLGSTCPKLQLEPQRQNELQYSEQANNAYWTLFGATISANTTATLDPAGYYGADKLQEDTSTAGHTYGVSISGGSTTKTLSVFAKAAERNWAALRLYNGTSSFFAYFNLSTGAVGSVTAGATSAITSYGNGWYRCSITLALGAGSCEPNIFASTGNNTINYQGVTGSGIYVWGAQLEAGAYATSIIPTLAASATRGTDACSKTGISSLIGQTEGVAFIDFVWNGLTGVGSYPRIIELGTDANNIIQLYSIAGTTSWGWDIFNGGVVQFTGSSTMALGRNKIAIGYKLNDMVIYKNGTLIASDATCTVPATSALGVTGIFNGAGGAQLAASVNQTLLFKTRLTNAELAELTTL